MSRLSSLLLALTGVLYPFAVYLGIERISPPIFALVLAIIWLLRAPSLWHKPGGRWMLAAALIYCLVLVVDDRALLLRWYPCLISLLLLSVFAVSLKFGPPMIERIARLSEPDLPAAGVRYTRRVTWVWIGFFVVNATISAALTLYAPLTWWTLYNGLLVYFIIGALLAGEWIVRRKVRRAPP